MIKLEVENLSIIKVLRFHCFLYLHPTPSFFGCMGRCLQETSLSHQFTNTLAQSPTHICFLPLTPLINNLLFVPITLTLLSLLPGLFVFFRSFINFQIWDFPGQIDLFNPNVDLDLIFGRTGSLVFVIDAQVNFYFYFYSF